MKKNITTDPRTGGGMKKVIVYTSNYGYLSKWDKFMNHLWFHVAEKGDWRYGIIYYPLDYLEAQLSNLKSYLLSLHAALTHQCDKHWIPLEYEDKRKLACPECEWEEKLKQRK